MEKIEELGQEILEALIETHGRQTPEINTAEIQAEDHENTELIYTLINLIQCHSTTFLAEKMEEKEGEMIQSREHVEAINTEWNAYLDKLNEIMVIREFENRAQVLRNCNEQLVRSVQNRNVEIESLSKWIVQTSKIYVPNQRRTRSPVESFQALYPTLVKYANNTACPRVDLYPGPVEKKSSWMKNRPSYQLQMKGNEHDSIVSWCKPPTLF